MSFLATRPAMASGFSSPAYGFRMAPLAALGAVAATGSAFLRAASSWRITSRTRSAARVDDDGAGAAEPIALLRGGVGVAASLLTCHSGEGLAGVLVLALEPAPFEPEPDADADAPPKRGLGAAEAGARAGDAGADEAAAKRDGEATMSSRVASGMSSSPSRSVAVRRRFPSARAPLLWLEVVEARPSVVARRRRDE